MWEVFSKTKPDRVRNGREFVGIFICFFVSVSLFCINITYMFITKCIIYKEHNIARRIAAAKTTLNKGLRNNKNILKRVHTLLCDIHTIKQVSLQTNQNILGNWYLDQHHVFPPYIQRFRESHQGDHEVRQADKNILDSVFVWRLPCMLQDPIHFWRIGITIQLLVNEKCKMSGIK